MQVILTRPSGDAAETADKLAARGHEVLPAPTLHVRFFPLSLPDEAIGALVVTSANGVRALAAALSALPDAAQWRARRVYAVGGRTAQAAREAGFADVVAPPHGSGAEALADFIAAHAGPEQGTLLYVSARDTAHDLAGRLSAAGFRVEQLVGYAAERVRALSGDVRDAIRENTADAVLFYSARSAAAFFDAAEDLTGAISGGKLRFLCLSQAVAAMMPETIAPERIAVAKSPEDSALLDLLDAAAGGGSQV